MENEDSKTILSQKYLEVIATLNGHQTVSDPTDPSTLRIRETVQRKLPNGKSETFFTNREIKGYLLPYSQSQVKQLKKSNKFNIDSNLYNELLDTAKYQRPTVLFICTWPASKSGAVIFSTEAMSMICTGYWYLPSNKSKPSSGSKPVSIEIPEDQIIDINSFEKIFEAVYV